MKKIRLNDGNEMPIISFGTYQMTNLLECEEAVLNALDAGYRAIDTAQSYYNEEAVGNALSKTNIGRENIFITTKIWVSNYNYNKTIDSFMVSLKKLQVSYVDLILIHQPFGYYRESLEALKFLRSKGYIKSIGISNFYDDKLADLCLFNDDNFAPAVNQIEINPFFQRSNNINNNLKFNVVPQAWAPFAEGRNDIFNNQILTTIAKKHNKSVAQVILRWLIERNIPFVTKSINKNRILENISIFDFKLDASDLSEICNLDLNESQFFKHNEISGVELMYNLVKKRDNNK
ncbi:aldo/keto reductase [Spiroplasma turonicum]|uniref:Oxidoreductase n=1 Tax=Spiroplasma turonicum TaxID=216946 RepID=A0A0K1P6G7_9MOLU|nr:aldo/keto reductase [Spiroplasma turonicum]AKU79911.1 oxidoreductase [Spiroplasma turonicum]ALX70923.1 2,5-diketo-D-gluconic acid reductase [Spiroplasma turonicum]